MTLDLNLVRRSVKGEPLTAADHDENLDKLEDGIGASVQDDDARLSDSRTPTAHKASHATGGADAITPADIGAEVAGAAAAAQSAAVQRSNHTGEQSISTVTGLQTAIDGKVGTDDVRLSNAREWSATTISQAEAEAGTGTTRRAFTAQRVFQAVAAWWASSSAKTKLDGIETGAEVNVQADWNASSGDGAILNKPALGSAAAAATTDFATAAQGGLADTAVQPGALSAVATSGAYGDLSGRPTLGTAAAAATTDFAPAAEGVTNGNSHDHSGGDGAQIAYSSLSGTPTLGGAAALNVGTTAGTVAAGDDARLSTDLSYDAATRVLASSTGTDATLPLVTSTTPGLMRPVDLGDVIVLACSDETTDLATGTAKVTFRMPWAATLTGVRLNVNTAPTGSALIVDVNEGGASVFGTLPQIDDGDTTSVGSVVAPVISDSTLAADAEITVDIDQVGSSAAGKGLKVALYVTRV
jgi:hypothetical protein